MVTPPSVGGTRVKEADVVEPTIFAVTLAVSLVLTGLVVKSKEAEEDPAEMDTEEGPPHIELVDDRDTVRPPLAAGDPILTTPVEVEPPVTELGLKVRDVSLGAWIVSVALDELEPTEPVITADVEVGTADVEIPKLALEAPFGTVIELGSIAA